MKKLLHQRVLSDTAVPGGRRLDLEVRLDDDWVPGALLLPAGRAAPGAMPAALLLHGYSADKDAVLARLKKIEGQVRGIARMVDDDTYCIDVLTQVSAATRALENVALLLLDDHLDHCVRHAAMQGGPEADQRLAEASAAIARLVRS